MSRLETIVSRRNTTTTPLSANTSFIGEVEELSSFQELTINVAGSPTTSAPATLYLQFSPNGTNWDVTIPLVLDAPVIAPLTLRVILPYFRVRYVNGSTALTQLRITSLLHRTAAKQLTRFLHQEIETNEPIENTRSVIVGQKLDGYYKHILVKDSGAIMVSGVGVAGTPDSSVITIQGINSGTAVNVAGTVTSNIGTTNGLMLDSTFTSRTNTLGQKSMSGSMPVTIASDQSSLTIDGYVTANIGNTNGLALDTTLNSLLQESTFISRINTLGQKTASASMPVVIASDQNSIPVTIIENLTGNVQKSLYDIGSTEIYIGTAAQGTASSAASWLIKKITLDGNGNPISTLYSSDTAIWDDRLSENYS